MARMFERGFSKLSESLCEINPRYNDIIINDLMAEETQSCGIFIVYANLPSKRPCYVIAAKHVS